MRPLLLDGEWVASTARDGIRAVDPRTGEEFGERYPRCVRAELAAMVDAGVAAARDLRAVDPGAIAEFLRAVAAAIEDRADAIAELAARETALPLRPRLREVEMARTVTQLRQAADAAEDGGWAQPTIDSHNGIRSLFTALGGPVLVIGPNNFPLAFNAISGGDFAAAIAAGNPVIAKAHPGHPGTTELLARCVAEALRAAPALPRATVQLVWDVDPDDGLWLAGHPQLAAIAFTGSRATGLQLKAAADAVGKPVYLEMSSVNPVVLLPGALRQRGAAIADELVASMCMGAGQFCTSPGLLLLRAGDEATAFLTALTERLAAAEPGVMLARGGPRHLAAGVAAVVAAGARVRCGGAACDGAAFRFQPTLLEVAGSRFAARGDELQRELFGTAALAVVAADDDELSACVERLQGNLCGAVYSDSGGVDDAVAARVGAVLRERCGRVLDDKMPTGVALSPAMNHGGPFPATGHPGFTAVGVPASLRRFAKLTCFDNVRAHRLPPLLRDANPGGRAWRCIDGSWTRGDVGA